jgi:hypothetical protein
MILPTMILPAMLRRQPGGIGLIPHEAAQPTRLPFASSHEPITMMSRTRHHCDQRFMVPTRGSRIALSSHEPDRATARFWSGSSYRKNFRTISRGVAITGGVRSNGFRTNMRISCRRRHQPVGLRHPLVNHCHRIQDILVPVRQVERQIGVSGQPQRLRVHKGVRRRVGAAGGGWPRKACSSKGDVVPQRACPVSSFPRLAWQLSHPLYPTRRNQCQTSTRQKAQLQSLLHVPTRSAADIDLAGILACFLAFYPSEKDGILLAADHLAHECDGSLRFCQP